MCLQARNLSSRHGIKPLETFAARASSGFVLGQPEFGDVSLAMKPSTPPSPLRNRRVPTGLRGARSGLSAEIRIKIASAGRMQ
jgi:hypothetical protein